MTMPLIPEALRMRLEWQKPGLIELTMISGPARSARIWTFRTLTAEQTDRSRKRIRRYAREESGHTFRFRISHVRDEQRFFLETLQRVLSSCLHSRKDSVDPVMDFGRDDCQMGFKVGRGG